MTTVTIPGLPAVASSLAADVFPVVQSGVTSSITNAALFGSIPNATVIGSTSTPNTFGFKNRIINGAFNIQQYTNNAGIATGSTSANVTDRWLGMGGGGTTAFTTTVASATLPTSSVPQNALTLTATGVNNSTLAVAQRIEATNVADLHNQAVAVQIYAASSNSGTVTWTVYYANTANTWQAVGAGNNITTGATSIATGTFTTTTSLAQKTFTFNMGANAATNGLMIVFSCVSPTGSTFTVTGIQLEKGSVNTPFDYRSYGQEMLLCNRYYQIIGVMCASTLSYGFSAIRTQMRTTPTVSAVSTGIGTGAVFAIANYSAFGGNGSLYQGVAHSFNGVAGWVSLSAEL